MTESTEKDESVLMAKMSTDINYIKDTTGKIEKKLDVIDKNYVSRSEFSNSKHAASGERKDIKDEMSSLRIDYVTFKTKVATWGTVGLILLGISQFILSKFF